jgi:mannan endo-1,4-beta-mannosidase
MNLKTEESMKLHKFVAPLFVAATVLGTVACDEDIELNIPTVEAPAFDESSPAAGSSDTEPGDITVKVKYDKRVFFATKNTSLINVSGATLVNANVFGTDSALTVVINCPNPGQQINVTIPEGAVIGAQGLPAPAVSLSFSTKENAPVNPVSIAANPVFATSAEAKKLYDYLVANYGTSVLSGMMANVAWNTEESEVVYGWTGKYPAINGFDYIHMPASVSGANWIDYTDITPVKNWADQNGIVTLSWHWNVPKEAQTIPSEDNSGNDNSGSDNSGSDNSGSDNSGSDNSGNDNSGSEEEASTYTIWEGETAMPTNWSGWERFVDDASFAIFAKAKVGDVIRVTIKDVATGAQGSFKNGSSWSGLTTTAADGSTISYEYFDISGDKYTMEITQEILSAIQKDGLIISGHDYTATGVYLDVTQTRAARSQAKTRALDPNNDYSFYKNQTAFDADNALVDGTWENYYFQKDLAQCAAYLKLLQAEGIPVLWRPFHEASGGWFWWGKSASSLKAMWKYMFDYFKSEGLDNLIWVWTSQGDDDDWYPGDAYVDIIGRDLYGETVSTCASAFQTTQNKYTTKMVTLSECGTVDNIPAQVEAGAGWSWFMPWYGNTDSGAAHADEAWWKATMEGSNVISRADLPSWK